MMLGAIVLSVVVVGIDQRSDLDWLRSLSFIFLNQPDGARTLLSTVACSMLGVARTTFSITLAVLTLTSQQLGPRPLTTFMRDTGNQVVLGTFVATSLYCLLVLRTVRDVSETNGPALVPHLAVTVAPVLTLMSLAVFIYFIHHTDDSIQVATLLERIAGDLDKVSRKLYAGTTDEVELQPVALALPNAVNAVRVRAERGDYLQAVDQSGLLAYAESNKLLVRSLHPPGTFVMERQPLALAWGEKTRAEEVANVLRANFTLGTRRTSVQDLGFLFDQLTEVALRALSPGINDPLSP